MQAAQLIEYGNGVGVRDVPKPQILEGKIIVEVHAAGVNPFDWKIREGVYRQTMPLTLPITLGGDFSGVVTEVGAGVSGFNIGDEVYGQANVFNGGSGSFAVYDLVDAKTVALKPKRIGYVEAAALPLTGVSALQALTENLNLAKDQKILIHGGAGGIGSIAIPVAKYIGAYVAATASTADINYVKELGADEVIDYKTQKFEDVISDYDAVYDTVGGDTYSRSFQVLRRGGVIVSMLEQPDEELMKQYGVRAIYQFTQVNTERLNKLTQLVDEGVIKAHIDKIFL